MIKPYKILYGLLVTVSFLILPALASAKVYPLDYWALRDVMTAAEVSPDGKHLAILKIPNKTGNAIIEVYKTEEVGDPNAKPFTVDADPMEFRGIYWVTNEHIVVTLRQKVRDRIEGFNQGVYAGKLALLNITKKKITDFGSEDEGMTVENVLPNKENSVIVSEGNYSASKNKIAEPFRPRSYWELNLKRGSKKLIIRGKISLGQMEFDGEGNPWLARGFDVKKGDFVWYTRKPGEKDWREFHRLSEDSFEEFSVWGFDEADRNILFVVATNGNDKRGMWEYNVATKSFGELIYRRNDVDILGMIGHSNIWTNYDSPGAVYYETDKRHYEFFDGQEEANHNLFASKVPNAHNLRITSRSKAGDTLTVYNSGPRDPGTYYLYDKGKVKSVGSRQPLIESQHLSDVSYISYPSRDGKKIHAYVTTPSQGSPPYPLIVLPHGGPFVQEMVGYDEWGQVLANNGYMVIQPQYRGSRGYGLDFYMSSFIERGEGGYKMQDDKDDGALYLVSQGLADKDRLAMFGWSYGGYSALVAAAREDQIYQCAIAGAAVADMTQQVNYYRDLLRGAQEIQQMRYRKDSISPINEADKVNIPLLIVHGDVDQRVPPLHAKKYVKALNKNNIPHKMLWLKGADHFYNTLFYDHQKDLYENMISFLKNDCGPGGL